MARGISKIRNVKVLSLKLPEELDRKLAAAARCRRRRKSALVREALERYLADAQGLRRASFLDLAGDLVGCVKDARPDLASNPKHVTDFGK